MDDKLRELISGNYALDHKIFPVSIDGLQITVAMVDTDDFALIQDLMHLTGKDILPEEWPEEKLIKVIAQEYEINVARANGRKHVREFKLIEKAREKYQDAKDLRDDVSIIDHINEIITKAINDGASDIHFEPYEKLYRVRFRLDGKLFHAYELSLEKKFAYISRLKIMAELDIAEKRRPQDGRIRMKGGNRTVDIRVSTMPTDFGEKVVLRILDKTSLKLDMTAIGFSSHMETIFKDVLQSPYGMILVTGPTGSGKTTTLYTALSSINDSKVNIMTIEDPIEYNLEGINQGHVRADIGFTFAAALRSFLRQDPDIIMVGEIRDGETAEIAIRSALTGHLVLSTLHTNDAPSAITRLVDMGIEPFLVATSVKMVMAQRLVRKICPHCKTKRDYDEQFLKRIGLSEFSGKLCIGQGCDYCKKTGYLGRTALVEMLSVSDKIIDLIIANAGAAKIRKTAIEEGMLTLRDHGLLKLQEGETTVDEVIRETMV